MSTIMREAGKDVGLNLKKKIQLNLINFFKIYSIISSFLRFWI